MTVVRGAGVKRPEGRSPRQRRVMVSFSGLDGAGKTRQIDELVAAVGGDRSVEVLWVPFKIWPESLLNRLPAGFRSRLGPKRKSNAAAKGGNGNRDGMRSFVWAVIGTLAAVSAGLSLRRRASSSSADVVVLDRYRLDSIVKLQFWYADVSEAWLARIVKALAPAPDLEFLLRVEPAVAYERKPEQWTVEQLATQALLYDRLAASPLDVVTLDAHADADEIAREVGSRVRSVLGAR